jgi:hypothetical protein
MTHTWAIWHLLPDEVDHQEGRNGQGQHQEGSHDHPDADHHWTSGRVELVLVEALVNGLAQDRQGVDAQ